MVAREIGCQSRCIGKLNIMNAGEPTNFRILTSGREDDALEHSDIAADKMNAYRNTLYRIGEGADALTLRIGVRSDELRNLFDRTGQTCGLFITAYNPLGEARADEANASAHAELVSHFERLAVAVIDGAGADITGIWPEEKSVFALGIDEQDARALGIRFRQDAVVWVGADVIPQLLVLR